VESILQKGLDAMPLADAPVPPPVADHDNLRGQDYYQ